MNDDFEDDRILDGDQGNDDGTIDDETLGLKRKCPKCGKMMVPLAKDGLWVSYRQTGDWACLFCGHEEKVKP